MGKKYDLFVSYNSKDKAQVNEIVQWLKDNNSKLSFFRDVEEIKSGDSIQEQISEALERSHCALIFFGTYGLGPWQDLEVKIFIQKEVYDKTFRIIPVVLPSGKTDKIPTLLKDKLRTEFKSLKDIEALDKLNCAIEACQKTKRKKGKKRKNDIYPFRGLSPFHEKHKDIFFGRENLIKQLMNLLNKKRFLVVVGESGCGKSSVVQAGLITDLRETSDVMLFTPGYRPLEDLATEILNYFSTPVPLLSKFIEDLKNPDELHRFAREILKRTGKTNLVIVLDQFETFLTAPQEEEHKQFIDAIINAVEKPSGPVKVVITLRSDFIGKCAFYPDLDRLVNHNRVQVQPMTEEELREVIEKPVKLTEIELKPGLTDRILKDVKGVEGNLPLLEHALTILFEYCKTKQTSMTLEAYEAIGRIEGALVKHAESEFEKLNYTEKTVLQKMFILRLIQPGEGTQDTRRIATKDEILAIGGDPAISTKILTELSRERLLICDDDSHRRQEIVAVPHEALIRRWDRLQGWLTLGNREDARHMGILRQRVSEWIRSDYNKDFLFQKARLEIMKEFLEEHDFDLTKNEREFISKSITQQKKRKWTKWTVAVLILIGFIITLSQTIQLNSKEKKLRVQLALNYWEKGRQAKRSGKRLDSVHLLAEAASINPDPAFQKTLLLEMNNYWQQFPKEKKFRHEEPVLGAFFNHTETQILTWSKDNSVQLWDPKTGKKVAPAMVHRNAINGAALCADDTLILTWSKDNSAYLWNTKSRKKIGTMKHKGWVLGACFSRDGRKFLTWSDDSTARLWDTDKCKQIVSFKHKGWVLGACFSRDGRKILTWSDDSTARLWDTDTCKQIVSFKHKGWVLGAKFNYNESQILTWGSDNSARLWNCNTGEQIMQPFKHTATVRGAMFGHNEKIILTWSGDGTARIWDVDTGNRRGSDLVHKGVVLGRVVSPDPKHDITISFTGLLSPWSVKTKEQLGPILEHQYGLNGAMFDKDEKRILTWSDDGTARIWDVTTTEQICPTLGHGNSIKGATFNNDSTLILTWSDDNTVRIWDANTGRAVGPTFRHQKAVNGARFNSDETQILTWSNDGTARIWDIGLDLGYPKNKIKLQVAAITGTIFNPKTFEFERLDPRQREEKNREYMKVASEHYKKCRYRRFNIWSKLFPKEAEKIMRKGN
jgi:WD40 repeat protein